MLFVLIIINVEGIQCFGEEVSLIVKVLMLNEYIYFDCVWIVNNFLVLKRSILCIEDICDWFYFQGIFLFKFDKEVFILIGSDVFEVYWVFEECCGCCKQFCVVWILFGWIFIGLFSGIN